MAKTPFPRLFLMALACAGGVLAQGQGRDRALRGGGPSMTAAVVPDHLIDVILSRPTATAVTLSALAKSDLHATLSWEPGHGSRTLPLKKGAPFEIELSGLSQNQRYAYNIASGGTTLVRGTFHTARPSGTPFRFVIQADSHLDSGTDPEMYRATLDNMVVDDPDFLIDLGDTFMTDKFTRFEDAQSQYVAQRYYLGRAAASMPLFLVLGNHDGETGWIDRNRAGMTEWARATRERYFPRPIRNGFYDIGPAGHVAYAWTWGDALFIVLDPFAATGNRPGPNDGWAWTLGRDQYTWLEHTLATSRAKHRFVFIHHLVGGSPGSKAQEARGGAEASRYFEWGGAHRDGTPGFAVERPGIRRPIHDLLKAQGVGIVFHGHDHLYARQERDGVVYQAVPQPGHRKEKGRSGAEYGYETGTILGSSGHVRVSVTSTAATVEYVRSNPGAPKPEVADRYTLDVKETPR